MVPIPLGKAAAFLIAVLCALPAAAMDVSVPADAGAAPMSGAGGAAASAAGALSAGPIAVVPSLSPALAAPSAAPLAAPVAAPAALAPAAAAPAAALAAAPAPALAAPSPAKASAAAVPAKSAKGPAAFAAVPRSATTVGDSGFVFPSAANAEPSAEGIFGEQDKLGKLFDGAAQAPAKDAPSSWPKLSVLGLNSPALAAASAGPGLKASPSAASAAAAPRASVVAAPAPPQPVGFAAAASKLWSKVKQGLGATPPPAPAPAVSPELQARIDKLVRRATAPRLRIGVDSLETDAGFLVHAPRALRFDALGYRVHFAPPDGMDAYSVLDSPERVRVERTGDDESTAALKTRFASFNALIEANFAALELMAQSSNKMTVKSARAVLAKAEEMAARYAELVGPERSVDETMRVASLGIGFDQAVAGLSDGDLLPPAAVALVMPLDRDSVHRAINTLHQAALSAVGETGAVAANMSVRISGAEGERRASLVDLSDHPLVKEGRVVSPAFKALLEAMRRSKDQPKGSLMIQDHQFWGHFRLGAHSAEVYANFLPPDEGGMIRVRYQEWGTGYDNQTRLYYVARLLEKTGFHVEQDNGFLTAVVDKDHASQSVDQMTDTFALVIQALHATVGVDFALPLLVQGARDREEVGARIEQWVDTVLGEGTLPFYANDDHIEMVKGWGRYSAGAAEREDLRAALNRTLARLGLPAIPAGETFGQRTVDRYVNAAIEAALGRGDLRLAADGALEKEPERLALSDLGFSVASNAREAGRMAEVVSSLDPGLFRFEPVGSLGALTVERAQRRFEPRSVVTVYALRDPKTGQIGLAKVLISDLKPDEHPTALAPAALFTKLAQQGYPVAPFEPSEKPAGLEQFLRLLKSEPAPEHSMGRRVQGLAASPGHGRPVLARVTYDKEKAARGGYVFVAAYTTPDDLDAIRASKAVITTSGGLLSHAAITTREMGIPAVILPRAEWRGGAASLGSPEFGQPFAAAGLRARAARPSGGVALAEGSLVRLDPGTGAVEVFPAAAGAALLDANAALDRYDKDGKGGDLAAWATDRLKKDSLSFLQKAALSREALDGLVSRALSRPGAANDLQRYYAALPLTNHPLAQWVQTAAAELFDTARRATADLLEEKAAAADSAISVEAVERALRQGEGRVARLKDVAAALSRSPNATADVAKSLDSLRARAKRRSEKLLADDVAELQEHARLFPIATAEVLPRLRAAVAKAKRRGVNPKVVASWEARVKTLESARETAMSGRAPAVLPLRQVLDLDVPRVGGKAAKLGEISEVVARAGGEVPAGLALTVDAYRRFLRETGIAQRLERVASDSDLSPDERAARARKLIMDAPLSAASGVGAEIVAALKAEGLQDTMLAVRSSAVDEDGAEAAFAGAGDTHLYVAGAEVLPHVKEIWASLWNPRALLYRQTKGLSTSNLAQAVVIQAMADSEVSGVAFTQDPVSGDSSRLIVNAAFGLGEGVVSGRVAPDQYVVGKALGREILPPMISDKKLAVVRGKDGRGVEEHKMPPEWRRRRSLTPAKLEKLNAVALALESHFGYALDIEFGFVGDKLYILQARPVTNAAAEEPAPPTLKSAKAAASPAQEATRRVMFVCTGNTCRSPMAERMAKHKLRLEGRDDVEVLSRGLGVAAVGDPMSSGARAALDGFAVPADGHLAMPVSDSDVYWADHILAMTENQAEVLRRHYPDAKAKIHTLGAYSGAGGDVADPYGGDASRYRSTALQIAAYVDAAIDRVQVEPAAPAR